MFCVPVSKVGDSYNNDAVDKYNVENYQDNYIEDINCDDNNYNDDLPPRFTKYISHLFQNVIKIKYTFFVCK